MGIVDIIHTDIFILCTYVQIIFLTLLYHRSIHAHCTDPLHFSCKSHLTQFTKCFYAETNEYRLFLWFSQKLHEQIHGFFRTDWLYFNHRRHRVLIAACNILFQCRNKIIRILRSISSIYNRILLYLLISHLWNKPVLPAHPQQRIIMRDNQNSICGLSHICLHKLRPIASCHLKGRHGILRCFCLFTSVQNIMSNSIQGFPELFLIFRCRCDFRSWRDRYRRLRGHRWCWFIRRQCRRNFRSFWRCRQDDHFYLWYISVSTIRNTGDFDISRLFCSNFSFLWYSCHRFIRRSISQPFSILLRLQNNCLSCRYFHLFFVFLKKNCFRFITDKNLAVYFQSTHLCCDRCMSGL